uniref:Uncharacterized protein n=1 Tax=Anguilla anguilla TaxID=7936 RepID=A0A0E9WIW0_ANGAN
MTFGFNDVRLFCFFLTLPSRLRLQRRLTFKLSWVLFL